MGSSGDCRPLGRASGTRRLPFESPSISAAWLSPRHTTIFGIGAGDATWEPRSIVAYLLDTKVFSEALAVKPNAAVIRKPARYQHELAIAAPVCGTNCYTVV